MTSAMNATSATTTIIIIEEGEDQTAMTIRMMRIMTN
jgi:hypothetical protein